MVFLAKQIEIQVQNACFVWNTTKLRHFLFTNNVLTPGFYIDLKINQNNIALQDVKYTLYCVVIEVDYSPRVDWKFSCCLFVCLGISTCTQGEKGGRPASGLHPRLLRPTRLYVWHNL